MAKGRKARAASASRTTTLVWGAAAVVIIVGAVAVVNFLRDEPGVVSSDRVFVPVTDFGDVHGLAVHPDDPGEVYVATHAGLIRGKDGRWERVGTIQDDYMGFSMHPRNGSTFWTSGHPKSGGNMGVRLSTDGGFTWKQIALDGVDFHAMTVSLADPDTLWGVYRGQLYRSQDGGNAWDVVNENPPGIRALAADPEDRDALYAVTQAGISKSTDGGKAWHGLANVPATGLAVDPTNATVMYAGGQGTLSKSTDAGKTWTSLQFDDPGMVGYIAVSPKDPRVVYAATYQTAVHKSTDAGQTWTLLKPSSR